MFGEITKQQVAHHFNKAKDFLGNAYNQTRNFLGTVDAGVRTSKHRLWSVGSRPGVLRRKPSEQARNESLNRLRYYKRAGNGGAR